MNDTMRWILFGVGAVLLVGLTILRLGMRGGGRTGPWLLFRLIAIVVVLAILAWRFFLHH